MSFVNILIPICILAVNVGSQSTVPYYDAQGRLTYFIPLQNDRDSRIVFNDEINKHAKNNKQNDYENYIQEQLNINSNSVNNRAGDSKQTSNLAQQSVGSPEMRYSGTPIKLGPGTTDFEQINNVTFAMTNFGVILLKTVTRLQRGNVIVSPTSIATVLALLQQGTTGLAQDEITRTLQMTPEITAPTYRRLTIDMQKRNSRNILTVANNLYVADGFDLEADFKATALHNFGSEVTLLDFSQPAKALTQINKWVSGKTRNKIENLLSQEAVHHNTQFLIVNAVYYKGLWETKFKPESTRLRNFHLSNGQTKQVPFMHMSHSFKYGIDESSNSVVTILPFERHQYSLILILPQGDTNVDTVASTLTNTKLVSYHNYEELDIQLELPKFTLKSDTDLIAVLKAMGISSIFDPQTDLSGIGSYRTYSPHISNAFHTGYMSIDEQGVSASAASSIGAIALSYESHILSFKANRPFIAVLWDTQFAIPLFIARIEDPSA